MSKIKWLRVINFESIEDAFVEFDERGIILLKGYNNSGKTAILQALKVLMYNWRPNDQIDLIQDDKEYFRILVAFDDGVYIMRDKYINGLSLYNMYKDGVEKKNLIFSTEVDGVLVPFDTVPEVIQKYLGVASMGNVYLNARDREDPLLLIKTTGSENYKFLNTVLRTDELVLASSLLNTDKNKKQAVISEKSSKLTVLKEQYNRIQGITKELVDATAKIDTEISDCNKKLEIMEDINNLNQSLNSIIILPELKIVDTERLSTLTQIVDNINQSSESIAPKLTKLDTDRITSLQTLNLLIEESEKLIVVPKLTSISSEKERFEDVAKIVEAYSSLVSVSLEIEKSNKENKEVITRIESIQNTIAESGIKMVKCDNCGNIVSVEG